MKLLKIITVVGTRPEIIRLSEVIKLLDETFDHVLVHTGQNYDYELNQVFFDELGLRKPDYFLSAAGESPASTVGMIISKVDDVLVAEKPDALLVLGDTNSCMSAYAAKRRKIPVFHMEAGNRCFDMRVPEEINRRLIDHISDINLVYSDISRLNLLQEGIQVDRVIKTGSPLFEVINKNTEKIEVSNVLEKLGLKKGEYFVLSSHREENIGIKENFNRLVKTIEEIAAHYQKPIVFSVHPRTRKQLEEEKIVLPKEVFIMKPLGLFDYLKLQKYAFCVISDSGTISEESSILNFPAINIRETHERHEAMDEGAVIMTGLNSERVIQSIATAVKYQNRGFDRQFQIPSDYTNNNVSQKVVRVIISYVDYVNRVVWSKS
jgi:UDP-N-acetyl-L-fucosamine synthase